MTNLQTLTLICVTSSVLGWRHGGNIIKNMPKIDKSKLVPVGIAVNSQPFEHLRNRSPRISSADLCKHHPGDCQFLLEFGKRGLSEDYLVDWPIPVTYTDIEPFQDFGKRQISKPFPFQRNRFGKRKMPRSFPYEPSRAPAENSFRWNPFGKRVGNFRFFRNLRSSEIPAGYVMRRAHTEPVFLRRKRSGSENDENMHLSEEMTRFPALAAYLAKTYGKSKRSAEISENDMQQLNFGLEELLRALDTAQNTNSLEKRNDFEADFRKNGDENQLFSDYFEEHDQQFKKKDSVKNDFDGNDFLSNYFDGGFTDGSFKDFAKKMFPGQLQEAS